MTSPPDDATSVADASADGTGSDAGPGTSDGSDGGSGSEASATAGDTGEAIGCGDAGCGPDMVCVHPCCGGAPPVCEPAPASGECPDGTIPVDPSQCAFGCDGQTCCQPSGPCEAPDPYCVPAGNLICGGDPQVADQCSVDDCFGTLRGDDLACTCA